MLRDILEVDLFDALDQYPRGARGDRNPQQRQQSAQR
jgi:hypothetical protein